MILIHNTVYLGDQYMNDGRKGKKELSGPAAHNDLKLCTENY